MILVSNSEWGKGQEFPLLRNIQPGSGAPIYSFSMVNDAAFHGGKSGTRLASYLHLVTRLNMSGAIPPLHVSLWLVQRNHCYNITQQMLALRSDTIIFYYIKSYKFRASLTHHQGSQTYTKQSLNFLSSPVFGKRPPLWSSGQSFWLQIQRSRVRFPALQDFLSSSGSGAGSTQPREVN